MLKELSNAQIELWYRIIILIGLTIIIFGPALNNAKDKKDFENYRVQTENYIDYLQTQLQEASEQNRKISFLNRETECLAKNIYFEARGESHDGMIAVAEVTRNRVHDGKFPRTYCGVVYQRNEQRCAFSWTCDDKPDRVNDKKTYEESLDIAKNIIVHNRNYGIVSSNVVYYHANYVNPNWSSSFEKVKEIGQHIFYSRQNGN